MTEPLLTISAFARAVDLAPSALRYYDESGLLPPTEVDANTGYRYYTPALERRAHLIRRMREVGVPIETMRMVLDGSPERAAEVLHAVAAQATESACRTASAVADVVASLRADDTSPGPVVVPVDGPELAAALRRISAATSTDADSPLGVVLLDVAGSELTVVATDRYWLAMWTLRLPGPHIGARRLAVPIGEVGGLADWLSRQGPVTLSITAERSCVLGDDEELTVATTDDRFPAYRSIVDSLPSARGRVTIARDRLLDALRPVTTPARLVVGRERVTISPYDGAEGVHIDAATSGEPITLGFATPLLRTALGAMVGTEATLSYSTPNRAVHLSSADQRSFAALVMPSRLDR